jgi:hypothetical protein
MSIAIFNSYLQGSMQEPIGEIATALAAQCVRNLYVGLTVEDRVLTMLL